MPLHIFGEALFFGDCLSGYLGRIGTAWRISAAFCSVAAGSEEKYLAKKGISGYNSATKYKEVTL